MNGSRTFRIGLLAKIVLFMNAVLVPLAAITWWISVQRMTANLTDELTSKGTAIAKSLTRSGVDLLLKSAASTGQQIVHQLAAVNRVNEGKVYDRQANP